MFFKAPLVTKKVDLPEMKLYVKYGWNLYANWEPMEKCVLVSYKSSFLKLLPYNQAMKDQRILNLLHYRKVKGNLWGKSDIGKSFFKGTTFFIGNWKHFQLQK